MLLYKLFSVVYAATLMGDDGLFLAVGWFCWEVVMSMLVFIVNRSSRPNHLDHLDGVTWPISTTPHLSRPSQITMLGWRLVTRPSVAANKLFAIPSCLVGSKFPFPTRPTHAFRIWRWPTLVFRSCEGSSYPPSIKRILTINSPSSPQMLLFWIPFRLPPIPIFSLVIALNKILQL